ncbi:hydrogenase nickel incorporation protein HypB [Myxococcota bacterium]|nr:hydrogenase nickel incorporation protein HypB [Myxococcota bacterium]MBU1536380.1 hydrogenase nickel incorporation protein HypB [Myxococcota bacterium]
MKIQVLKNVMLKNDAIGADNRWLFDKKKVFAINMTSSPGAGKTTLIRSSLERLTAMYRVAVIEGDLFTSRDAERLEDFSIPLVQINTEGGCHLDAKMVHAAIEKIDLDNVDLCIVENVGNLVCPAAFDIGAHRMVLLYSITEGEDKPAKYATMFTRADVVIINKVDIAPYLNMDLDAIEAEVRAVNPTCRIFRVNSLDASTLTDWFAWLDSEIASTLQA